jgi:aminoglycoside phosphotransferase family enzyme
MKQAGTIVHREAAAASIQRIASLYGDLRMMGAGGRLPLAGVVDDSWLADAAREWPVASRGGATRAADGDQAEVIAFLGDPRSYALRPDRVERCETHGALVFLAGDEAWKIKRAVRFPWMDFSTLEKRRAACLREVEINRRLAPDLYLACVPIARTPAGQLECGGTGEPVEWAVRMRRFPESALLSRMAEAGPLPPDLVRDLADTVYASHREAAPAAVTRGAERFERLAVSIATTLADKAVAFADGLPQQFAQRATEQLRRAADILDERAAAGFVRRCHADLHLNNIVLWQGRPALFDAIEFDDDLATIDTLYDLAFLLMDLDQRGQRAAANAILNRYLWRSGAELNLRGLAALPLFLALRAAVRAMVTAERAEQEQGRARARQRKAAGGYLDAALAYLAPAAPRLIAVGGLSGTGKSTLARALAPGIGPAPGAVHLRSDLERKALYGVGETVRLGPHAYGEAAGAKVYAILCEKIAHVLAAGHAGIVDAVFARPEERAAIERAASSLGVPFLGLWLEAPPEDLIVRVGAREGDASDATPEVVRQQLARGGGALSAHWTRLDAGGSAAATLEKARKVLAGRA